MPARLPSPVYPITDPALAGVESHAALAKALLAGGAKWLQLRDKTSPASELLGDCARACRLARARRARLIVNDRPDLALAAGAHGVHLGEEDLPAEAARRVLGPRALIGVSTHTPEAAERAAALPVDYVALGPIYHTSSVESPHPPLGLEGLRRARVGVRAPLVAIGGIGPATLGEVLGAGADAAAMISEVCAAPEGVERRMRALLATAKAALAERALAGRHLFLVGFMGAGKSTLGPLIAERLGRPFLDLDREIERAAGGTIPEIFARSGEPRFRALEREALEAASRGRDAVIALGGGALGDPRSRRRVERTGVSVWLEAPVARLWERCRAEEAPGRPLARDPGSFRRLYRARRPLYAAARLRVSTGSLDPRTLADRLAARLRRVR